jgi:molybdopterin-synthase adenylyltransferase
MESEMPHNIADKIKRLSSRRLFPDNTPYPAISVAQVQQLSADFGISGREVEIYALKSGVVPERYARNMRSFSIKDQERLLASRVSIVGLGGLGGLVTEILARTGVGFLNLIDGDTFEENNLNRQLLSTQKGISASKSEVALQRLREINTSIMATSHRQFLSEDNAAPLLEHSDAVVDCLDDVKTRFVLEKSVKHMGIPLVSAAVAGNSGHVTTIFPKDPGLALIYGEEKHVEPKGIEASQGCLPYTVSLLASLQCSEVVKLILGRKEILRNRLLLVDLFENMFEVVEL